MKANKEIVRFEMLKAGNRVGKLLAKKPSEKELNDAGADCLRVGDPNKPHSFGVIMYLKRN